MTQHTKSPWVVFENEDGLGIQPADGLTADVAHFHGMDTSRSREEERANARLCAAAPELLAACMRVVDPGTPISREMFDMCRDAIFKATGAA